MDEYNINNIQRINSINFINISDDKVPSRSQKPFYKLKQIEYLNPIKNFENSYAHQKGKYSQRYLSKSNQLNKKYIIGMDNIQNSHYSKPDIVLNDLNDNNLPVSSVSLYNPQKNLNIKIKYQTNKLNYSNQKINPPLNSDYNNNNFIMNNNYLNNFSNNTLNNNNSNDYPKNEELNQRNNSMLYENKINEYKKQSKILLNKLNFYIKDSKSKSKEIFDLKQKNKNLQNELNKYNVNRQINNEKNINNNNDNNIQAIAYKSKTINKNKNFQNINKNNYRTNNKNETGQEIKNMKQKNKN